MKKSWHSWLAIVMIFSLTHKDFGWSASNYPYYENLTDEPTSDQPESSQSDSPHNQDLINYYQSEDADTGTEEKPGITKWLSIKPLGEVRGPIPPECHPRNLDNNLVSKDLTAKDFSTLLDSYVEHCEKYWNAPEKRGRYAMLDYLYTEYDLTKSKSIKYTSIQFRDGSKVDAYIAMQDQVSKRPWVIAKCGVFCDVSDSTSVQIFLMHLFDQSPFNVIFLGNRTGINYIETNQKLSMGGYLEAHDYYETGYWLKEVSPYKNTIDSLHVLGMSLSGNAALYVEPLAGAYGFHSNRRLFQSVMSLCPVVNLKPTMDDMYTAKSKKFLFRKLTWDQLQKVKPALGDVSDILNGTRPDYSEFPIFMANMVVHYSSLWAKNPDIYRQTREIRSPEDLWELNQFSEVSKKIQTPVFVWASKDDMIVSNEINTANLLKSEMYQNSSNLGAVNMKYGGHCAFAQSYGYPVTSAVLRSFVLSHSGDFLAKRSLHKISYNFGTINFGLEKHLRQWWQAYSNLNYVTLNFETHNDEKSLLCKVRNIYEKNAANCRNKYSIKVPLDVLKDFSSNAPQTNVEAEVLSRKLNGLLRLTADGNAIEGSSLRPNQIEWYK